MRHGLLLTLSLLTLVLCIRAAAQTPANLRQPELLTNLFQLRHWAESEPSMIHPFQVVADVIDADSASGVVVLRDFSGVEFVRLGVLDKSIEPGAVVRLEGKGCALRPRGIGLAVVPRLVVDNDGVHGNRSESGTVFLNAGMNPITLQWFNSLGDFTLNVEYEGPNLPRQRIPSAVLSTRVNPVSGTNVSAGLDYHCYEGSWEFLPDYGKLQPAKTGVVAGFDLNVRTRNNSVGLEFSGSIAIPEDGAYTFYVTSDDGSRLFVGESSLALRVMSNGAAPRAIEGLPTTTEESNRRPWVALEGTANFIGVRGTGAELEMRVGNNDVRVEIFESGDFAPSFPPHSRLRVSGIYQDVVSEGLRVPGLLQVSSWKSVNLLLPSESNSRKTIIDGETKEHSALTERPSAPAKASAITTVAGVKALTAELAGQQLPVVIRGVVTATLSGGPGAVVQDSTGGAFVFLDQLAKPALLRLGESCQIEGVTTPGLFAPAIHARQLVRLGDGKMPAPVRASCDQLVNGSLDTQYAEIDGVVTGVHDRRVVLRTERGKIALHLIGFRPEALLKYENALVRIRGCVFAPFNNQTRQLEAGPLRIRGAAVQVLQAAPRDVFDVATKNIGEVLLYNPKATPLQLLRVSGQILYGRSGESFLSDGTNAMHVTGRNTDHFKAGELVEAVGFLDLGGPLAALTEAMVRKIGEAPLPTPIKLAPEQLLLAKNAGTFVQVEATLMNQWLSHSEYVLELQSAFLVFRSRVSTHGKSFRMPANGSRLQLNGVYSPQGSPVERISTELVPGALDALGNRGSFSEDIRGDRNVTGFELLVPSPAAILVLATPPWWTLTRVLILAGMLAALLCTVLVWNKQLWRQVQERGQRLEIEIHERQRAELQHAAEVERSRIARDLHDELGAGLTEVSLLASAGLNELSGEEKSNDRFRVIAEKARALVSGLDVIVWAIDPKRNSLQSFADYVGSYAKELLSASNIVCRLKIPIECDAVTLSGAARHGLFLAVKEALNNVIRHASAKEVALEISPWDNRLQIIITDNGRGFDWNTIRRGHGLTNLRERMEALHGECQIKPQPEMGTTVRLIVPLTSSASSST